MTFDADVSSELPLAETALRFDEQAFLYDALMFFKRTFDPIHVIAVSIWHPTNDFVIARSGVTKKHIRNKGNYFTHAELMHRPPPRKFERSAPLTSAETATKEWRESVFLQARAPESISHGTRKYNRPLAGGHLIDGLREPRHVWP